MSIVVLVHSVGACTGSCAGQETVSYARTVMVGIVLVVIIGRQRGGGLRVAVIVLVHSVSACTGSCTGHKTVSYARAVLVRFGAPGTWGNGYKGILRLRAHGRVLGEARGLLGVHVVVCCGSGHERDGGVVIV